MKGSIITLGVPLFRVFEAVDGDPAGIAFVEDQAGVLVGVLTDGDLRRMILKGVELSSSLEEGMLGEFVYARQGEDLEAMMEKIDRKVRFIPIVDDRGRLVDYFRYEHRTHFTPVAKPDLRGREFEFLSDAFMSTWISSKGPYLDRFEAEFASFCDLSHGVAVSNGTVALELALQGLGIGKGDEVIVPDLTFAATANAVIHSGATPVIVDVDSGSWCMDPQRVEEGIGPRTKAIIPVHLYGQPCDMDELLNIARREGLFVVEDCAEAHGASYGGKKVGSLGDVGCFSFFGNKILTTGEGGICVTEDPGIAERMRILRDHGMSPSKKYWHEEVGNNFRMTNLQASIGCAQLERIDELINEKKRIEKSYKEKIPVLPPFKEWQRDDIPDRKKVTWLACLLVEPGMRDPLIEHLQGSAIEARPFFYPLSVMPPYQAYAFHQNGEAGKIASMGLSLPTYQDVDVDKVARSFNEFIEQAQRG